MPINSTIFIQGSVGRGGKNMKPDVTAVQQRLNDLMNPPRKRLVVDGLSGPRTEGMIADFQINVLKFSRADRRVDPAGKTIRALNNPASEGTWARMSIDPNAGGGGGGAVPSDLSKTYSDEQQEKIADLRDKIAAQPDSREAVDFLDFFIKTYIPLTKELLATATVTEFLAGTRGGTGLINFVKGIVSLRRLGFSAAEIVEILVQVKRNRGLDAGLRMLGGVGKYPRLAMAFKRIGRAAFIAGIVVCVIEAGNYFRKGQIGPGMAEVYGTIMSIGVPWAAAIDAAQTLLYAYFPEFEGSPKIRYAFRVLNAINPIGAGKTAVDTGYTLIKMVGDRIATGEWNASEIDGLVRRMENSPMRLFTEAGEFWGDVLGDLTGDWFYRTFLK